MTTDQNSDRKTPPIVDLTCAMGDRLRLDDPFMIASSHHTENETAFKSLMWYSPSALTLKTVSNKHGGAGSRESGLRRDRVQLRYPGGSRMGSFTDGPKKLELWDTPTCTQHLQMAKQLLPGAKVGLSVGEGENYTEIAESFDLHQVDFVELNWKYSFRNVDFAKRASEVLSDLAEFMKAFVLLPVFVKIPAELLPFLTREELVPIFTLICENDGAVIVANTKKAVVPPSRQPDKINLRTRGVVCGEQLFLDSFNGVRTLDRLRKEGARIPMIIATGGITDIGAVVDLLAAGAEAVQLCSALDYRKASVIDIFRRQLRHLIAKANASCLDDFKLKVRAETDHHKAWLEISQSARALETYHDRVTVKLASNKKGILQALANTLRKETLSLPDATSDIRLHPIPSPERIQFLINRSNIAAFILSHRIIRECGFTGEVIDDSKTIGDRLKDGTQFDYAVVPKRVANAILESHATSAAKWQTKIVGIVGQSIFEVVGSVQSLKDIQQLFHFTGTGSKEALKQLLPKLNPKPRFRDIEDPREELSPLLTFWEQRDAILARGPLSFLYPMLADSDTLKNWKSLFEIPDDLVLLSTSRPEDGVDENYREALLRRLRGLSYEISTAPERAAREAIDFGYVNHVANLLGANVLA